MKLSPESQSLSVPSPVRHVAVFALCLCVAVLLTAASSHAQRDPGPRGGAASAGNALPGLTSAMQAAFDKGLDVFQEVEDVANNGLGPRFNSSSCVSCHSQPMPGGTSPAQNPQTSFQNTRNALPFFITPNGPAREARFIRNPDGTPDGGVHALFTIMGRTDTPVGCNLNQPDFSNRANISLRIPTPVFGLGLIEAIPDSTLVRNLQVSANASLGINGRLNRNGNDGTITRFGWKAQNKSLLLFSGEAYNVEMGITNLIFNTEREESANCTPATAPNSDLNLGGNVDTAVLDDINDFANFMRLLAPPARGPIDNTATQGFNNFVNIGCANCHSRDLVTGEYGIPQLANQTIHPFSDFALHHMGPGLADQISQGIAGGDEFRTAPLWGVGQRLFFLHDGRTTDLMQAIAAHASGGNGQFPASEANTVVGRFNALSVADKQAVLNFLRSL